MIGPFTGTAGLIYLLLHLHYLWGDVKLLNHAVSLSRSLLPAIDQDPYFDVLNGAAGVIPVMLALADTASGEGLQCAERCADHLLRHAVHEGATLSWPLLRKEEARGNLTGFAHGAGGVGWALIALQVRARNGKNTSGLGATPTPTNRGTSTKWKVIGMTSAARWGSELQPSAFFQRMVQRCRRDWADSNLELGEPGARRFRATARRELRPESDPPQFPQIG